jgi:hypothetical protein
VTGTTREESLAIGLALWERTGMVVNTIGTPEKPAMTCQARPQEAEVFGEFPPRRLLQKYTKYPVVVPSSTPAYDSAYTEAYLQEQSQKTFNNDTKIESFLKDINDDKVRGYCVTLVEYLMDATKENPKRGFGSDRTALWGLQRPPLQTTTYLRCHTSWEDLAPSICLFYATNAKNQVVVSTENESIRSLCETYGIPVAVVDESSLQPGDNLMEIVGPMESFAMVGQFLSTLLPVGHIKSTLPNDEEFVARARGLEKWLQMAK